MRFIAGRDAWMVCDVSPGQFSNEFAVGFRAYDGKGLSLFANSDDVRGDRLRVNVLDQRRDMVLIALPTEALGGERDVTVAADNLTQER